MIKAKVSESLTLALLGRVREMRAQGIDVASMAAGEPDFQTPDFVIEAAVKSMKAGNTKYVASQGQPNLREAIAKDYRDRLGAAWVKPEHIVTSVGAKQGIHVCLAAVLELGDEVLIPKPYWVSYPSLVKVTGGVPVFFDTQDGNGFFPTAEECEKAYTPKTKALIFSSPNNPTGKMISEKLLRELIEWCNKRGVVMIYDEIYERLTLGDRPHVTPFALVGEAASENILCVNAFSKSLSMTGWRLGYVVSHKENIKALTALQTQFITSLPGFIQDAAANSMDQLTPFLKPVIDLFRKRRDLLMAGIARIPGLQAMLPDGAFYTMVNVEKVMARRGFKTDAEFSEALLNEQKTVVTPGSGFGMPGWIRLSFATSEAEINKALERIATFCGA